MAVNRFAKYGEYEKELLEETRGANRMNWAEAYIDTRDSIERIERLEEYENDKNSGQEIFWFAFLIVGVSIMYILILREFNFSVKTFAILTAIGVVLTILLCIALRIVFYNAINKRLAFAENRRLIHESRWPGISKLVLENIKNNNYEIPEEIGNLYRSPVEHIDSEPDTVEVVKVIEVDAPSVEEVLDEHSEEISRDFESNLSNPLLEDAEEIKQKLEIDEMFGPKEPNVEIDSETELKLDFPNIETDSKPDSDIDALKRELETSENERKIFSGKPEIISLKELNQRTKRVNNELDELLKKQ